MNGNFLLDTNILIAFFGNETSVVAAYTRADSILIPSIVIGELYYGAQKSKRSQANVARIDDLVRRSTIVPCDAVTAHHYGLVKNELRKRGTPIPENDIWIAALAQQHTFTLVTNDHHFAQINTIVMVNWLIS